MSALRIVFAGTPEFAAHHLSALLASHHQVVAVYTQPDRPAGRGKKMQASAVKMLAAQHQVPVEQPLNFKLDADQQRLKDYQADVMVVVAYGLLLPIVVLDTPRLGCINVHASLLPRWRGAAPIQRAIEAGDSETGVTIMQMDVGLDTGDMLNISRCAIDSEESASSLHDKLWQLGCPAMIETLNQLAEGAVSAQPQDHNLANYAHKLSKQEALIDWSHDASAISRRIRAFNPFPVCFSLLDGERVRVWAAQVLNESSGAAPGSILEVRGSGEQTLFIVACGSGVIGLKTLQLAGKKVMSAQELVAGYGDKFALGRCFSNELPA